MIVGNVVAEVSVVFAFAGQSHLINPIQNA